MDKKNPLLAGLLNALIPGLGRWYVNRDAKPFAITLIVSSAIIAGFIWIGSAFQSAPNFPLPQGVCVGALLLIVLIPLFLSGQKAAVQHNFVIENAVEFTARQSGNNAAQLARNQHLRDKGYISEQEFDSRKDSITSNDEKPNN